MKTWRELLFPDPPRSLPAARGWNIVFRTAHLAVAGILLGGHVFGIPKDSLVLWLQLTLATGAPLLFLEVYPTWRWCCEGRGLMVLAKLGLLCLIPWLWDLRVAILVVVVILASVGSHMSKRYRYLTFFKGTAHP